MGIQIAIIISIVLMGSIAFFTYYVGKKTSRRLIKYIPAVATGFGLVFFYIKMNFIAYESHAFEGIYDMIAIISLAIICAITLLGAMIIDIANKVKSNFHN